MVPMEQKGKHDIGLLFVYHKYEKRRKASGKTADQCMYVWCLYVWCLTRMAPGEGRVCMRGADGRCWAGGRRQTCPGAAPCWAASSHAPGQASPAAGS